ncbi:Tyrosine recombinase XerC [Desulfosporosinus sp. I2]|uniref:tyrosine-type recombinase/integrase n=1 Tax=Desulfosporosinus sp. I2 TaxID=1617025 RepID=UPI00061F39AD|nr:tyrosine-type recombinase/integrase [Desulfosporosinus sp. I2]KJR44983.1 Tyrosine recombinase XerC [Desulfosporosinus sp. I2]
MIDNQISPENYKMINEFLEFLEVEEYSTNTLNTYRRILITFFMRFKFSVSDISYKEVSTWLEKFEKGKSAKSINLTLSALSSFFKFCYNERYITRFPIKKIWFCKIGDSMPKYLDKSDHAKVRITAQRLSNVRDRAIAELFDVSGIRLCELHGLNKEDINLIERTALVLGKGKKQRLANFTEYCAFLLERVMNELPPGNGPLFVSLKKTRLCRRSIQYIIERIGRASNLGRNLHPQIYRHTFATDLVNKGADLQDVQDELGHASPDTTKIYARILQPEILNVYRRCME